MDRIASTLSDRADRFLGGVEALIEGTTAGVVVAELGLILALWFAAVLLARRLEPPLEDRLRRVKGRPRLLRVLAVLLRRLRPALYAAGLILAAAILDASAPGLPTALIWVAAKLAAAWVAIAVTSRVVRNRFAARLVAAVGWTLLALALLGLLGPVADELDRRAITVGTLRLSLLAVVKATALLAVLVWLAGLVGGSVDRRLRRSSDLSPSESVSACRRSCRIS